MIKLISVLILVLSALSCFSQDNSSILFDNGSWQHEVYYPEAAKDAGIKGEVEFKIQIDSLGCISDFEILSSPDEVLSDEIERVFTKPRCKWSIAEGSKKIFDSWFYLDIKFQLF